MANEDKTPEELARLNEEVLKELEADAAPKPPLHPTEEFSAIAKAESPPPATPASAPPFSFPDPGKKPPMHDMPDVAAKEGKPQQQQKPTRWEQARERRTDRQERLGKDTYLTRSREYQRVMNEGRVMAEEEKGGGEPIGGVPPEEARRVAGPGKESGEALGRLWAQHLDEQRRFNLSIIALLTKFNSALADDNRRLNELLGNIERGRQ